MTCQPASLVHDLGAFNMMTARCGAQRFCCPRRPPRTTRSSHAPGASGEADVHPNLTVGDTLSYFI